jgi:hypothetical protein
VCFYRLEDEPSLTFNWLVSIDRNNSLKRWDTTVYGTTPCEDSQIARSTYWLSEDGVDKFKYEVKSRMVCFMLRSTQLADLLPRLRHQVIQMPMSNMMTMTGQPGNLMPVPRTCSTALTDGAMQDPTCARKHFPYLRSLESSSHHVVIGLSYWPAIWSKAESCMSLRDLLNMNLKLLTMCQGQVSTSCDGSPAFRL